MRRTHGGVLPWRLQGSRVTVMVNGTGGSKRECSRAKRSRASRATISAWRLPAGSVAPPISMLCSFELITQATDGFGDVLPEAKMDNLRSARHTASSDDSSGMSMQPHPFIDLHDRTCHTDGRIGTDDDTENEDGCKIRQRLGSTDKNGHNR